MSVRPELLITAGPNGAGKSTFAAELLRDRPFEFLSADAIAAALRPDDPAKARIAAGRAFTVQVDRRLAEASSFVVETTLSGQGARRWLARARTGGYRVTIFFVYLDTVEACLARIRERVLKGGHDVPEEDVRRRFVRSVRSFWREYRFLADRWMLCYNSRASFVEVAVSSAGGLVVHDEGSFAQFLRLVSASDDG